MCSLCKKMKNEKYERAQQPIYSFDKVYRKALQDKIVDEREHESLCKIFMKDSNEGRNDSFAERSWTSCLPFQE